MNTLNISHIKMWIKHEPHWLARTLKAAWKQTRYLDLPVLAPIYKGLYGIHRQASGALEYITRLLYWTPLFQSRLQGHAPRLFLYGGLPAILGPLSMSFGSDCRVAGKTTFSGRATRDARPTFTVGNNVGIGWGCNFAVGREIVLQDNVRVAANCTFLGYPGHPLSAEDRAAGMPDTDDQVGDIVLEQDVWLGGGVTVLKGVTIGRGTVVGAGSVVSKSLPAGVLAAGCPAKVIRKIDEMNEESPHEKQ